MLKAATEEVAEGARRANLEKIAASREAAASVSAIQDEMVGVRLEGTNAMTHARAMHEERDHLEREMRGMLTQALEWSRQWQGDGGSSGAATTSDLVPTGAAEENEAVAAEADDEDDRTIYGVSELPAAFKRSLTRAANRIRKLLAKEATKADAAAAAKAENLPQIIAEISRLDAWPSDKW